MEDSANGAKTVVATYQRPSSGLATRPTTNSQHNSGRTGKSQVSPVKHLRSGVLNVFDDKKLTFQSETQRGRDEAHSVLGRSSSPKHAGKMAVRDSSMCVPSGARWSKYLLEE